MVKISLSVSAIPVVLLVVTDKSPLIVEVPKTNAAPEPALMVTSEGVTPVDDKRAIARAISDYLEGLVDSPAMLNAAE